MTNKVRGTAEALPKAVANEKKGVLTRPERVKLMAETMCDERTIRKWERGDATLKDSARDRLEKAARKLDIPIPEKAS